MSDFLCGVRNKHCLLRLGGDQENPYLFLRRTLEISRMNGRRSKGPDLLDGLSDMRHTPTRHSKAPL